MLTSIYAYRLNVSAPYELTTKNKHESYFNRPKIYYVTQLKDSSAYFVSSIFQYLTIYVLCMTPASNQRVKTLLDVCTNQVYIEAPLGALVISRERVS